MKLTTFSKNGSMQEEWMIGASLDEISILNLQAAAAFFLKEVEREHRPNQVASRLVPTDMRVFLEQGEEAMNLARRTIDFIQEQKKKSEHLIFPLSEIKFKPPVPRPGKIIALGENFYDHAGESKVSLPETPVAFLKVSSALIGHGEPVSYPPITQQLDYEVELAIVVGKRGKNIPQEKAYEYVAGYTIFNDLSARDLQAAETRRPLLLSKNMDGFGPMGPYLVTRDEIPNPEALMMELYVNQESEPRQKSYPSQMIFKIPEVIAFFSQMTLEPGDIVTSGTPGGVAMTGQPDPNPWYLKRGDVVEARIQGLGILRNTIV